MLASRLWKLSAPKTKGKRTEAFKGFSMRILLAFVVALIPLAHGQDSAGPVADSVIRAPAGKSEIVITTTERLAGAIHSVTWDGMEFIDSFDHGRQLQSASSFQEVPGKFNSETYNPTEAGSCRDGAGKKSSSQLRSLSARGSELRTKIQMAYWLAPGEKSNGDLARNDRILSNHVVTKVVRIGARGLPHAIEVGVAFTVPPGEKAIMGQFEALTGYMPDRFRDFWKLNLVTGQLEKLEDGPGEQKAPVVMSTAMGGHAMGIVSPESLNQKWGSPGYGRWRFVRERVVKWNTVFRVRNTMGIAAGDYTFHNFVAVGSLEDVRSTLMKLLSSSVP